MIIVTSTIQRRPASYEDMNHWQLLTRVLIYI